MAKLTVLHQNTVKVIWSDKQGGDMNRLKNFLRRHPMRPATNRAIVFSFLLILISAWPVWGATYYVKSGGNDSLAGTSDVTAWATTAKVQATVTSGDTVYFRSQDTWSSSGNPKVLTATAGVTYDGSTYGSGSRAKFLATADSAYPNESVVQIYVSNVIFRGIEIDGGKHYDGGIYIGTYAPSDISKISIDNCYIHDTGIPNDPDHTHWAYGINVGASNAHTTSNVTIINTEVSYTFHEGIAVYPSWGTYNNRVDTVLIRNCYLHHTGTVPWAGTGVAINNNSNHVTVEFCTIAENSGYGINIRVSPPNEGGGNVLAAPNNMIVRYNIFSNNQKDGIITSNCTSMPQSGDFYGNVFYGTGCVINNESNAVDFWIDSDLDYTWEGTVFNIYNNTFYSTVNVNTNARAVIAFGYFSGSLAGLTVNFKNNIVVSGDYWAIMNNKGATVNHSNNLIYRSSTASGTWVVYENDTAYDQAGVKTWEPTAQNTAPAFTGGTLPTGFNGTYGTNMAPNTNYFAVTSGNALDKGATLGSPYNGCINGAGLASPILRPQGAGYDIGAYEHVESVPNPPTNLRIQ